MEFQARLQYWAELFVIVLFAAGAIFGLLVWWKASFAGFRRLIGDRAQQCRFIFALGWCLGLAFLYYADFVLKNWRADIGRDISQLGTVKSSPFYYINFIINCKILIYI
jgi:hypothetical protein